MDKTQVNDLAIFGGLPIFDKLLHVGRPNIGQREKLIAKINGILDNRWFTNDGPYLQEFEQRLTQFLCVRNCIAICNGTIALEIAARALGLEGEVVIPSFTFIATAHALQWQGITPVFCDVDPLTHNIDPMKIEKLITSRTSGILGVHVWGRACDINQLSVLTQKYNLKLLFDAAHALACTYRNHLIGGFGNAEVFSFHATKFFNTFEGGAVATNDDQLAEKIRRMRNFGFAGYDNVIEIGTNGKMSEISAAMGLISLDSLESFIQINKENYLAYKKSLEDIPGIRIIKYNEKERNNYQYFVIEIDEEKAGLNRDELMEILHAENILARRYFYPGCHQMEPYRTFIPNAGILLPETNRLTHRVLQLPTGTDVDEQQINTICNLIRFLLSNGSKIRQQLKVKNPE